MLLFCFLTGVLFYITMETQAQREEIKVECLGGQRGKITSSQSVGMSILYVINCIIIVI